MVGMDDSSLVQPMKTPSKEGGKATNADVRTSTAGHYSEHIQGGQNAGVPHYGAARAVKSSHQVAFKAQSHPEVDTGSILHSGAKVPTPLPHPQMSGGELDFKRPQ